MGKRAQIDPLLFMLVDFLQCLGDKISKSTVAERILLETGEHHRTMGLKSFDCLEDVYPLFGFLSQ